MTHPIASSSSSSPYRCEDVARLSADYAAGAVSAHDAEQLEQHAAECVRCEAQLMLLTSSPAHDVVAQFAPPVPPTLRDATLMAVASSRTSRVHTSRVHTLRWRVVVGAVTTAAAVIVIMVARREPSASSTVGISSAGSATSAATTAAVNAATVSTGSVGASMLRVAEHLAHEQARAEFVALDAAAAELDAALARTPADMDLRVYRAAVQARRNELAQRVRDVTL